MKLLLVATILLLVSPCARADVPYVHLLGSPQVRRELRIPHPLAVRIVHNLNEAARLRPHGGIAIANRNAVVNAKVQGQRKPTPPDALERQVMTWLSPAQKQRLEQIELQMGSPFIFEYWRFARRVGVSAGQYKQLQPVFKKAAKRSFKEQDELFKRNLKWYGRWNRNRYAAKYLAYAREFERIGNRRKTAVEAAMSRSLTPVQKARWRALLGKPFRMRLTYDTKSYPLD